MRSPAAGDTVTSPERVVVELHPNEYRAIELETCGGNVSQVQFQPGAFRRRTGSTGIRQGCF
jgi:hypothetical protein